MKCKYNFSHFLNCDKMKNLPLLILIFFQTTILYSQTNISGTVIDASTNDPLIGVNVVVNETSTGTVTDIDGQYSLTLTDVASEFLVFSYTGYEEQKVAFSNDGSQQTINISLGQNQTVLQDVVVTANKKLQSLQDVPASITALSPTELRRSGASQFRDYASSVPNLTFGTKGGQGALNDGRTSNQIVIRGIAGGNTTAMYLDETPLPANIDPRLVDIGRVEILRGPQGTLYGSSSMGGAIKTITNQPITSRLEGNVTASIANVEEGGFDYDAQGTINIPISDKLAFRGTGFYQFETGVFDRTLNGEFVLNSINPWTENAFGETTNFESGTPINIATDGCANCQTEMTIEDVDDETNFGFNASLGFYPTKNISIVPKVIYQKQSGDGLDFADNSPDNFNQTRLAGLPEFFEDEWGHYSLTADIGLGKGKIVSSTSFTDRTYNEQEDQTDFLATNLELPWAAPITRGAEYSKFVQEVRYQSQLDEKFNFIAGAFYANEDLLEVGAADTPGLFEWLGSEDPTFWEPEFGGLPPFLWEIPFWRFTNNLKIEEFSLFGEAYYDLTDKLTLTAGLRYFNASTLRNYTASGIPVDFEDIVTDANISEYGFNPKFNLSYKISQDNLVYGTLSKGFRLGGVNDPVPVAFCGDQLDELGEEAADSYTSDDLWNYELGYKGVLANGKVILNVAGFYNSWSNIQQFRRLLCGFGYTSNAGAARILGTDIDLRAKLTKDFEATLGLGLLNPVITEGGSGLAAEKGDRILFTPTITSALALKYNKQLSDKTLLYINANLNHVGERFSTYEAQHTDTDPMEIANRTLGAYTLLNARAGLSFSNYEVSIFANNITGETPNFGDVISLAAEVAGRPRYTTGRPRTIGLQARIYF